MIFGNKTEVGKAMQQFIEKIRPNVLTDDEVLREAMMFQLRDYPLIPVELTNEILAFCMTNEATRKSLLSNGEDFPKNEQSIELLLKWVDQLPFNQKMSVARFLRNVPAKIMVQYADQLMYYVGKDYIRFCEQLLDFENMNSDHLEPLWEYFVELLHEMSKSFTTDLYEKAKYVQEVLIGSGGYDETEIGLIIKQEQELEDDYFNINGILAVRATGLLQLHDFIPVLVSLLDRYEEDLLLDEVTEALIRFQSDEVVEAIAPYIHEKRKTISIVTILKDIKTPLAERTLVEAYAKANDVSDKEFILDALTSHFSEQAFPLIEDFLVENRYAQVFNMEEMFYGFYKAMGREHPQLQAWRQEMIERNKRFEEDMRHYDVKVAIQEKFGKVGRNDPCICGSGKKFKKCCGK